MIPKEIEQFVTRQLELRILAFKSVSGGCINNGGQLTTTEGELFIKWNVAQRCPKMFEVERKGMTILLATNTLHLPKVVATGRTENWQYIVMEFISADNRADNFWRDLGTELAALHRNSATYFGLDHDNYIGSLPQLNNKKNSWAEFFIECRLEVQLKLLFDRGVLDRRAVRSFESLYPRLSEIFPSEKAALLHGDLWSGNVIAGPGGAPYVIDPAVYYGHREAEIAFTKLFGGFPLAFYESYNRSFPLQPDFGERYSLYNLYPLLVHANLFGESYLGEVKRIIKDFS